MDKDYNKSSNDDTSSGTATEESQVPAKIQDKPKNSLPENFRKIKVRALIIRIVKAVLLGLTLALPVIGVLMLLYRFSITELNNTASILIGGGVFLLTSSASYFLLRKTDKAIAKKLDSQYHLNEKIQTMLAFSDEDSPMLELQRQDANKALESVKKTILGINRLWIYILCFVLAAGAFVLSLFFNPLPKEEDPPPPVIEIPYQASELQLKALQDVIKYVENSEMESPYKENVITALNTLYDEVSVADTVSKKDEVVLNAMTTLLEQADQSSFVLELVEALWEIGSTDSRALASTLNYYEWPKEGDWDKYLEMLTEYRACFAHKDATGDVSTELAEKINLETIALFTSAGNGIILSLENSQIPEADAIYKTLLRLANANEENSDGTRVYGMYVLSAYLSDNSYAKAQRELDATISALNGDIYKALVQNKANTGTAEYAVTRLASIFGVKAPKLERPNLINTAPDDGDDIIGGVDGGIGGGPSYGSDDKVYDPFTNKYVEYGTILNKYYEIMFAKLQNGDYTDEEKKALEKYFDILYGGFDESEE